MKSAYELAMERLQEEDPASQPITEEMKQALADIDEKFNAKVAEREIFLKQKMELATVNGERSEAEAIGKQIASEKARLEEERELAKENVRNAS